MKSNSKQPAPEEAPARSNRKQLIAPMLMTALSIISRYLERCECNKPHKALLLLFSHKTALEQGALSLRFLFSPAAGAAVRWKETYIKIKEEL
jgi:hypothetical protein